MLAEVMIANSDIKTAEIKLSGTQEIMIERMLGCAACSLHMFAEPLHPDIRCSGLSLGANEQTAFAAPQVSPISTDTAYGRVGDIMTNAVCLQDVNILMNLPPPPEESK